MLGCVRMTDIRDPESDRELRATFPAIDDAFTFVVPSYQWLMQRFEAADNRLTALLALLATLTLGAPVFGRAVRPTIAFDSFWFLLAMLCFAIASGVGVAGRAHGRLILANPLL